MSHISFAVLLCLQVQLVLSSLKLLLKSCWDYPANYHRKSFQSSSISLGVSPWCMDQSSQTAMLRICCCLTTEKAFCTIKSSISQKASRISKSMKTLMPGSMTMVSPTSLTLTSLLLAYDWEGILIHQVIDLLTKDIQDLWFNEDVRLIKVLQDKLLTKLVFLIQVKKKLLHGRITV